jgi:small-conductance mechanosensitive channel
MASVVGHIRASHVFGEIVKWYVFIIFLQSAVDLLRLGTLSTILTEFVLWLPNVIVAAVVIIFGVGVSHYIGLKIEEHTEMKGTRLLSRILKIAIIVMVIVVALSQIGVDVSILENTFLILVGSLAVGIAIALGIGLGKSVTLNGKKIVKDIEELVNH